MYITELSIKRPVVAVVFSMILVIFGLFVFSKLPVRELPSGLQPPVVQVQVDYKGASAEVISSEITEIIEDIIGGAAQVRSLVPLALEAMQTEHDADRTNFMMMKSALTDACILTGDILQRMISLFSDLNVFPKRMRANLDLSGGLIMSELVMLELGKIIGRQKAHDLVYESAQNSVIDSESFLKTVNKWGLLACASSTFWVQLELVGEILSLR
jgi:hypothetical protein